MQWRRDSEGEFRRRCQDGLRLIDSGSFNGILKNAKTAKNARTIAKAIAFYELATRGFDVG
jgi:hypothetical protein